MDIENIITPFIIRNNIEDSKQRFKDDIIQISSESDVGDDGEKRLSQSSRNNNNSLVKIGFTKKCIDIRDCYEFIGLQTTDDPTRKEEVPEHNYVQLKKREHVSPESPESCSRMNQGRFFQSPPSYNCLKINLKQRIKQHESRTRRREQYKEFKRHKDNLRKILLVGGSHSKFDVLTLIRQACDQISDLQKAMEENIILFSKEERKNFLLREQLQRLTADNSCWPYNVEVTSDTISIKKMENKFTF